jgi:hypothetical protein
MVAPLAGREKGGGWGGVAGNCFPDPVEVDGSEREGEERSHSVRVAFDLGKVGRERGNAKNIPETAGQMPCHCQFATPFFSFSFLIYNQGLGQRSNPTRPCVRSFVGLHIATFVYGIFEGILYDMFATFFDWKGVSIILY